MATRASIVRAILYEPVVARFLRRLASFSRLMRFSPSTH
jgi:hypothetical protein